MAEAEQETVHVPPSLSDEEEEDESRLQTIELNPEEQKPVLSFQPDNEDHIVSTLSSSSVIPSVVNNTPMPPSATTNSNDGNPIEASASLDGTQLEGRTPVTKTIISSTATLKDWGFQQFKVTKQVLSERFGKGFKTVDASLETRLEGIKDTQKKYQQLMALSGQLQFHLLKMVETQKAMAEHFAFLSVRCPELDTEFEFNSETQKRISRNGETLVASLKFFISNVHTVSAKSIEDTLVTGRQYEMARILYDAYRTDLETMTKAAKTSQVSDLHVLTHVTVITIITSSEVCNNVLYM